MTNWPYWGTVVNTVAVFGGALFGLLIRKITLKKVIDDDGDVHEGRSDAVMRALGLCVILIGISGALRVNNLLIIIISMALGTLLGEWLNLDGLVGRFGKWIERRFKGKEGSIADGFVSATLLFCVGAMTVTGAIESAVYQTHHTYYAKSLIDMASAAVFASALGAGVLLSSLSVLLTQGLLTLLAVLVAGAIPTMITGEMIATGSLLVLGIGTNLLGVTKLKVMNMLPAMFLPILLCPLFDLISIL